MIWVAIVLTFFVVLNEFGFMMTEKQRQALAQYRQEQRDKCRPIQPWGNGESRINMREAERKENERD